MSQNSNCDLGIWLIVATAAGFLAGMFFGGAIESRQKYTLQKQAVERGHAEYNSDRKFRWIEKEK